MSGKQYDSDREELLVLHKLAVCGGWRAGCPWCEPTVRQANALHKRERNEQQAAAILRLMMAQTR